MMQRPCHNLDALYRQHSQWLCSHLRGRGLKPADAEDLCQQLFLRFCEHPQQLEAIRNPRAWFATIANRLCVDHWRREEVARRVGELLACEPEAEVPSPERQVASQQTLSNIADKLHQLPASTVAIFLDSRLHALTGKQVAQCHQVPLRTVRHHLRLTSRQLLAAA